MAVFVFLIWRFHSLLRGQRVRYAMALAGITGAVSWLSFTALWLFFRMWPLSWDDLTSPDWLTAIPLGFALLVPATLLLSSIKVRRATRPEPGDSSNLAKALGMGALYMAAVLFSGAFSLSGMRPSSAARRLTNQASAAASLRVVSIAARTYELTYGNGFPPNLAALGPPTNHAQPSASAAGLIDEWLAQGKKGGYTFTYAAGSRDAKGKIETYTLTASPLNSTTGTVSYFTDQSAVIRFTYEDRPATAQDPAIGGQEQVLRFGFVLLPK